MSKVSSDSLRVELTDLVGIHEISAIWRGMITVPWLGGEETVQAVVLQLDDQFVLFTENPNDGYRSSLGDVYRTSASMWIELCSEVLNSPMPSLAPIHPPVMASFSIRDRSYFHGERAEVLYAIDECTDLCIFEIGTDNIDDYYPSFIFDWRPLGYRPTWLDELSRREETLP